MQNPYLTTEARLIYARVFHDLAAPLGALTLCVDDIKKALPDSAEIIEASIDTLSNKIRYWRLMLAGGDEGPNFSEAMETINNQAKLKGIKVIFGSSKEYQGVYTRLLLAIALVCLESLPRGGEVVINSEDGKIHASGEKCYIPKEIGEAILQKVSHPSSRHALGLLIISLAKHIGCVVEMKQEPAQLFFSLSKSV